MTASSMASRSGGDGRVSGAAGNRPAAVRGERRDRTFSGATFNEAVDETLTESMDRFAMPTDLFRDRFIGVLSHDLRTPLGAVTTGAALLAVSDDNPQRRSRVVTRIMNSAQRMERMIGDLLDLRRAWFGGAIPIKRGPANLQQVCEEAVLEIRAGHPEAVLRLNTSGNLRGE